MKLTYQGSALMKNTFLLAATATICTLLMCGCSKSSDPTPTPISAAGSYQVEYRVSSTTATEAMYFAYTNDTGGYTTLTKLALPGGITFKRTMKTGDVVGFAANLPNNSSAASDITGVILLDGKQVVTGTGRGAGAETNVTYVIH